MHYFTQRNIKMLIYFSRSYCTHCCTQYDGYLRLFTECIISRMICPPRHTTVQLSTPSLTLSPPTPHPQNLGVWNSYHDD